MRAHLLLTPNAVDAYYLYAFGILFSLASFFAAFMLHQHILQQSRSAVYIYLFAGAHCIERRARVRFNFLMFSNALVAFQSPKIYVSVISNKSCRYMGKLKCAA